MWGGSTSRPPGEAMCRPCRRAATAASYETTCADCGETFTPPPNSASRARPRKYCSRACASRVNLELARANRPPLKDPAEKKRAMRARTALKRARRRTTQVEPVIPSIVFERDGWRCHLCGKKCRTDVDGRHPQGATIDHLIPLSKCGPHTYVNIATAHRACNVSKGNRASNDQLALIG